MTPTIDVARRRFMQASAAAASGLVIGFYLPPGVRRALAAGSQAPAAPAALPDMNAFLEIATDDTITIRLAHAEMGQGIWTTLAMLVAEELECDWSNVRVEHAPAAQVYAHTAFGMQMTGGSTTTWSEFDRYRQVGAVARDMLVRAAAAKWGVPASSCRAENGFIVAGERRLSFGAVATDAQRLSPPASIELKPASAWKIIGKPTRRLDSPEKVTGKAEFGLDVRFPGLMTAVVERAPVFGGTVKRFSADKALATPGVRKVVQVPSGIAVVADHFWAAAQGREALEVEWDEGPGGQVSSAALLEEFRALARTPGTRAAAAGDAAAALAAASSRLEAEYDGPYLAHATMEPLNCTVKLSEGACEIWTGTQFQTMDQQVAAKIAGLDPSQVKIHTTFLGGGFGRRATTASDFVAEAVHVAKAAGVPVKVVWTREDDTRGGYYRPLFVHRVEVGLDAQGQPVAWRHRIVCQSLLTGTPFEAMVKDGVDESSVEGVSDSPYLKGLTNHLVELHSPRVLVPVLWWRSVGHTHTAFVMETLVDELAHRAKQDPVEYRRRRLSHHPRHLGALNLAAQKAGWGDPLPAGRSRGMAVHESFGSYVAEVAEVSVEGGRIRVHRVVCAIDCGICVNPEGVRAQMESGIAYGLSAALHGEITIEKGRVQQSNFHDYEVLRLDEMPRVDVHIVPSTEKSGGAGEPGTPLIAPAVANAVFAATGQRLRRLPFRMTA
jgi:isoquinoline 1-oxidoreductase beta subunit